jgi:F0F1-type ATP synthase membrane subunit c/vacuolar-type H+-ATPase subunit K
MLSTKIIIGLLHLGLGVCFILIASGVLATSKDPEKAKKWRTKYPASLVIGAVIYFALGIYNLVR